MYGKSVILALEIWKSLSNQMMIWSVLSLTL